MVLMWNRNLVNCTRINIWVCVKSYVPLLLLNGRLLWGVSWNIDTSICWCWLQPFRRCFNIINRHVCWWSTFIAKYPFDAWHLDLWLILSISTFWSSFIILLISLRVILLLINNITTHFRLSISFLLRFIVFCVWMEQLVKIKSF